MYLFQRITSLQHLELNRGESNPDSFHGIQGNVFCMTTRRIQWVWPERERTAFCPHHFGQSVAPRRRHSWSDVLVHLLEGDLGEWVMKNSCCFQRHPLHQRRLTLIKNDLHQFNRAQTSETWANRRRLLLSVSRFELFKDFLIVEIFKFTQILRSLYAIIICRMQTQMCV